MARPIGLSCLEMFRNKLLFSGLQIPCDLNQYNINNPGMKTGGFNQSPNFCEQISFSKRFEIYVLTDLPETIVEDEIKISFKSNYELTPYIYKLFGQNIAYVIFTKTTDLETFLKKINFDQNINYNEKIIATVPLINYTKNCNLMTYDKYISSLTVNNDKISTIIEEINKIETGPTK
jgi:hypothetical protein